MTSQQQSQQSGEGQRGTSTTGRSRCGACIGCTWEQKVWRGSSHPSSLVHHLLHALASASPAACRMCPAAQQACCRWLPVELGPPMFSARLSYLPAQLGCHLCRPSETQASGRRAMCPCIPSHPSFHPSCLPLFVFCCSEAAIQAKLAEADKRIADYRVRGGGRGRQAAAGVWQCASTERPGQHRQRGFSIAAGPTPVLQTLTIRALCYMCPMCVQVAYHALMR